MCGWEREGGSILDGGGKEFQLFRKKKTVQPGVYVVV